MWKKWKIANKAIPSPLWKVNHYFWHDFSKKVLSFRFNYKSRFYLSLEKDLNTYYVPAYAGSYRNNKEKTVYVREPKCLEGAWLCLAEKIWALGRPSWDCLLVSCRRGQRLWLDFNCIGHHSSFSRRVNDLSEVKSALPTQTVK